MTEKRYCLNCSNIGELTKHGRCSSCDSEAVVLAESHRVFEVQQLEHLYKSS